MTKSNEAETPNDQGSASSLCSVSVEDELEAMTRVAEALGGKDQKTCARILDWAASVFTTGVLMDGCLRSRDFLKDRNTA